MLLLRIEHDLHNYQCLELTSWAYPAVNINSCLQALTNDISTPADIARSALETIVFCCFLGYISALTYYLLLLIKWISLNVEYDSEECLSWTGRQGVSWSFLLNVPYIIIAIVSAVLFLRQRDSQLDLADKSLLASLSVSHVLLTARDFTWS